MPLNRATASSHRAGRRMNASGAIRYEGTPAHNGSTTPKSMPMPWKRGSQFTTVPPGSHGHNASGSATFAAKLA